MITFLFGRKRSPPRRRSLENPSTPLSDPDEWLVEAWGGGKASSGVAVNAKSALTYSPVWRATCLISGYVAKIPLIVYRREGDGKERDTMHPAYRLLKHKANTNQTFFQFRLAQQARALLRGNAYAYIFRDGNASPLELVPLDPTNTYPVVENTRLLYVTKVGEEQRKLLAENVLHIRGLGDDLAGHSVIGYARESFGLGMAAQKYGSVFFRNSARPSVVLQHPATLGEEAARTLRESWEKMHTGLEEKHRIAILEEGMTLNPFSMSNEDAQFLETRQQEIREVANWFGLPPHKLGDTTRTAYASLEQENQSLLDDCLDPWYVNWESECWDKLLSEEQKAADSHVIEFLRQALVRANLNDRSNFYASALQNGWMNRDEIRGLENLNPLPDGEGKKFFWPLNMAEGPPDEGEAEEDPGESKRRVAAAHRALLCDVIRRMARRLSPQARKQARSPKTFMAWLEDSLEGEHRAAIIEAAAPAVQAVEAVDPQGREAGRLSDIFFRHVSDALLAAAECQPQELERVVAAACERLEGALPALVVGEWMEDAHGA
jgi:HK97 family phage portal protein